MPLEGAFWAFWFFWLSVGDLLELLGTPDQLASANRPSVVSFPKGL